ncbi:hypothetical protein GCM10010271_48770 [Streptomyces kurssanovii]|nr:hypothetical protein GCM10010271_48770 [Streptomyces kurssanovii]
MPSEELRAIELLGRVRYGILATSLRAMPVLVPDATSWRTAGCCCARRPPASIRGPAAAGGRLRRGQPQLRFGGSLVGAVHRYG